MPSPKHLLNRRLLFVVIQANRLVLQIKRNTIDILLGEPRRHAMLHVWIEDEHITGTEGHRNAVLGEAEVIANFRIKVEGRWLFLRRREFLNDSCDRVTEIIIDVGIQENISAAGECSP